MSIRRILATLAVSVSASLVIANPATAASVAPPGNSGATQYLETVPGAGGNTAGSGGGSSAPQGVPNRTARQLAAAGLDGQAILRLAARTLEPSHAQPGSNSAAAGRGGLGASGSASAAGTVTRSLVGRDGGFGLGLAFPLILGVTLLGMVILALSRRRSTA